MKTHFKKLDWMLIASVIMLSLIGSLSIYSSSLREGDFSIFNKQVIFLIIGIILMFVLSFLDWKGLRENPYFILFFYFLCVLALAGLFFFAPQTRGIKGWYKLGSFSFDPIGLTRIVLIILLAKYFSIRHIEMYRISHIALSGIYIFFPTALIFLQPDFGSALILIALWVGILVVSGIKLRHFLVLAFCGLLIVILSWSFLLKDYQKERIISFAMPQIEPLGMNWSQNQAKIAIGSGGIFGQGFGKGSQTQYGFLSEPHTDFIFAAIAEEFGLIGVFIIFCLFLVLIWRIIKVAILAQSNFPRLFALGLAIIIVFQAFIHIGMNIGILPVIGLSFPLVSYGGSELIAFYIGLGILQSIKNYD